MHAAVESGEVGVVRRLLTADADTQIKDRARGRTPLHLATISNQVEILKVRESEREREKKSEIAHFFFLKLSYFLYFLLGVARSTERESLGGEEAVKDS